MNKHLYIKLLRKGWVGTVKEIEARERIVERGDVVYSTQHAQTHKAALDKNKGCIAASDGVQTRNAFDPSSLRSARTGFVTVGGKLLATSRFRIRG